MIAALPLDIYKGALSFRKSHIEWSEVVCSGKTRLKSGS